MVVYVINKHGKPLMPCSPRKARILLKTGKAKVLCGNAEMIEHNHNGYLAEPFVPEELAKGMDLLLDDPMLCSTMGSRARQKIESGFNIQSVSEQYMRLYQSITGRRK